LPDAGKNGKRGFGTIRYLINTQMKNIVLLVIIQLVSIPVFGQVAIINDSDGFTNVRKQPNTSAAIIYKLQEDEVFWYNDEVVDSAKTWIKVIIPKQKKFSDYSDASSLSTFEGYIHITRLLPLDKLPSYREKNFTFKYQLKPFNPKSHTFTYADSKSIIRIDNKHPWGIDGEMPKVAVEAIKVSLNSKPLAIPKTLFSDIFECTNKFEICRKKNTYFVYQSNSDGAGGYDLVWVFTASGFKHRLVGSIY
jgi:hypothetical protein